MKKQVLKWSKKVLAVTGVIVMSISLLAGCAAGKGREQNDATASSTDAFDINSEDTRSKTEEIEKLIDDKFYFEEDAATEEESYYDGIMAGLNDPYSVYYTKDEYQKLMEDDGGVYYGIGATVSKNPDTNLVYVVKPLRGSPAEEVGLQKNDVFVEVDGTPITKDMELEEVVKLIRGKEGTVAHLKMYREGEDDYLEFDVTRRQVQNITVDYKMLTDDIGYISVEQFIDNTPDQFKDGIDALEAEGAKSLILDFRNNPGGSLAAVLQMADYIIADDAKADGADKAGLLLETKDKNGTIIESYSCTDEHSVDLPMVVLANENSASASEIFTGCMKDYGVAKVIGTTTFGKGIVQQIVPLSDGSAIKLTIAKYFTPSGADIHKKGIAPDIEVELDESIENKNLANIDPAEDNQLQRAVKELGGKPLEPETASDGDAE